jgi:hypothetical protein
MGRSRLKQDLVFHFERRRARVSTKSLSTGPTSIARRISSPCCYERKYPPSPRTTNIVTSYFSTSFRFFIWLWNPARKIGKGLAFVENGPDAVSTLERARTRRIDAVNALDSLFHQRPTKSPILRVHELLDPSDLVVQPWLGHG